MRILLVTPMLPRPEAPGAIPLVLYAQLVGLSRRHHVTLVTVVSEGGELDAVERLRAAGVDVHVATRYTGPSGRWRRRFSLTRTWLRGRYPWRTIWFAVDGVQNEIDRLTSERSFDVVAIEDNAMGIFKLPKHLPVVLTEYEVRTPRRVDWRPGRPSNWGKWVLHELDSRRWRTYQARIWSQFELVQVFTARDAATLGDIAPGVRERVRVAPFGVEIPPALALDREEPDTVFFVGDYTHRPNVDAARWLRDHVMPGLWEHRPSARLLLAGSAVPREVNAMASENVEIIADAPRVADVMARASVVLAPVRAGGGMRMKVLLALASGKAVVTTSLGAEGLDLTGSGTPYMLVADDLGTFVSSILTLLDEREMRHGLGRRARNYVEQTHSPGAYASRLEATYAEAVARHAGRG